MRRFLLGLSSVALLLMLPSARAQWVDGTDWPVARLVENLERRVQDHPGDTDALYALGRIHAWAFVYETTRLDLWVSEGSEIEQVAESVSRYMDERARKDGLERNARNRPPPPSPEQRLEHLTRAVRWLMAARERAPERAEVHLSLAIVLEHGAHLAGLVDSPRLFSWRDETDAKDRARIESRIADLGHPARAERAEREILDPAWFARSLVPLWRERATSDPERHRRAMGLLERWWLERAAESFARAFALASERDRAMEEQPMVEQGNPLDSLVSWEAGQACLRLAERLGTPLEEDLRARVEDQLAALQALPPCEGVTPLLLPPLDGLDECPSLDSLLARDHAVLFDLDGDGREEAWPWIRPEAGWLVWDPERRGRITSGRQLLGDRSGWFLFGDGYHVLDALDDDGDGALRGAELDGLALWLDRDSDGVSDPGEVVPVADLGIAGLATAATERLGRSLANPCGVELADGRVLPSYDWVLEPLVGP